MVSLGYVCLQKPLNHAHPATLSLNGCLVFVLCSSKGHLHGCLPCKTIAHVRHLYKVRNLLIGLQYLQTEW